MLYFIHMFGYKIQTTPLYRWIQLFYIILLDMNFDKFTIKLYFLFISSMFEIYRR